MQKAEMKDRTQLIRLLERISPQNMISMEAETYAGSYLDGVNWDYLTYVYNKELYCRETAGHQAGQWVNCEICYKDAASRDSLVSDFDDLQRRGISGAGSRSVTVFYEED